MILRIAELLSQPTSTDALVEVARVNGMGADIEWNPNGPDLVDGTKLYALKDKP